MRLLNTKLGENECRSRSPEATRATGCGLLAQIWPTDYFFLQRKPSRRSAWTGSQTSVEISCALKDVGRESSASPHAHAVQPQHMDCSLGSAPVIGFGSHQGPLTTQICLFCRASFSVQPASKNLEKTNRSRDDFSFQLCYRTVTTASKVFPMLALRGSRLAAVVCFAGSWIPIRRISPDKRSGKARRNSYAKPLGWRLCAQRSGIYRYC